jgi:hypothetical protein
MACVVVMMFFRPQKHAILIGLISPALPIILLVLADVFPLQQPWLLPVLQGINKFLQSVLRGDRAYLELCPCRPAGVAMRPYSFARFHAR